MSLAGIAILLEATLNQRISFVWRDISWGLSANISICVAVKSSNRWLNSIHEAQFKHVKYVKYFKGHFVMKPIE
jgi:hypothetical protein